MEARIEEYKDNMYIIRIYGSDGLPCDAYVVSKIYFSEREKEEA